MTKEQANKALYLVAVLSLVSLIVEVLALSKLYGLLIMAPMLGVISVVGCLVMVIVIAAPFLKKNWLLLFVIVDCVLGNSYLSNIQSLYDYFINNADFITIGVVPGILISFLSVIFYTVGLSVLILRCYGYIKEHRAGLKTKF